MNKDLNLLCMSCFSPLPSAGAPCPVCGYIEGTQAQSPHHLPIRTILAGKYLIGRVLGEGGFGITYMGYDLNLDIRVAVKEYFPSGFATRTSTVSETVSAHTGDTDGIFIAGRERFVNEAKRLAHFRTLPGIVMVNDFFAENGTAYIVMEYVEGQTLKEYLAQQGGTLPAEQVVNMLAPVFASLAQVHGSGIIHRDISPDNIMITPDGSVKLLDFGAAREFSESGNKSLSVLLKHGYAPMEQYTTRGKQGPWTDVYALAATIYKAITGKTPEGSMDRVMEDLLALPSRLGVPISPQQESVLMKALEVKPEDRFQTVSEFYNALNDNGELRSVSAGAAENGELSSGVLLASFAAPVNIQGSNDSSQINNFSQGTSNPYAQAQVTPESIQSPDNSQFKKKPAIIASVIAACVLLIIILAFALPGGTQDDNSISATQTPVATSTPSTTTAPTPTPAPAPTPTPAPEEPIAYDEPEDEAADYDTEDSYDTTVYNAWIEGTFADGARTYATLTFEDQSTAFTIGKPFTVTLEDWWSPFACYEYDAFLSVQTDNMDRHYYNYTAYIDKILVDGRSVSFDPQHVKVRYGDGLNVYLIWFYDDAPIGDAETIGTSFDKLEITMAITEADAPSPFR